MTARIESWRRRVARPLRAIGYAELVVSVVALVFVVTLSVAQMLLRSFTQNAPVWIQEVVQLAIIVSMCAGTSYAFKLRDYISIGIVVDRLPERVQIVLNVITQVAALAFTGMLAWTLLSIAGDQLRVRTYIIGIPRFYFSLPLTLASISMALTAVYYGTFILFPASGASSDTLVGRERSIAIFPSREPDIQGP